MYSAFLVDQKLILENFFPKFPNVFAHHITERYPSSLPPCSIDDIKVVGYARDENCECVVVSINGSINRANGGVYHITISTNVGIKPVYSNQLIAESGWQELPDPIVLQVSPKLVFVPVYAYFEERFIPLRGGKIRS